MTTTTAEAWVSRFDIAHAKQKARDLVGELITLSHQPATGAVRWDIQEALDRAQDAVLALGAAYDDLEDYQVRKAVA